MQLKMKNRVRNIYESLLIPSYSQIFFVDDSSNWVLSWEIKEIMKIAKQLGYNVNITSNFGVINQSIFYASKYILLNPKRYLFLSSFNTHIAFSYFHGYPNSGNSTSIACYKNLKKFHRYISRIQVSHSKMKNYVLETGINPKKVFMIPIGINPDFFYVQTRQSKRSARKKFGIPQDAVVIGSFQKDGVGQNEGHKPKLIKGPDVLLKTLSILKNKIPNLFLLLSGPSRGYIINGLNKLRIPYKHFYLNYYPDICNLYQCLDLYIVSSREEGGPKAILESMTSGVPLVTTCVGQAMDLVNHGINAMMTPVEDSEGLAHYAQIVLEDSEYREKLVTNGLITARKNTYFSQTSEWNKFFEGFVNKSFFDSA